MSDNSIALVVALVATIAVIMFFLATTRARARASERRRDHTINIHEEKVEQIDEDEV